MKHVALFTLLLAATAVRGQVDGSLDPSFGTNGISITGLGPTNDAAYALAVQADGKIVSAGLAGVTDSPFANDFGVVRYNTNGTLDTSFGMNGKVTTAIGAGDDQARALVIQPNDGKIVVAGSTWIGGNWDLALVRYLSNGMLDNTFGNNGTVIHGIGTGDDVGFSMALQLDGKILVGGHTVIQGTVQMVVARFNANGSIDGGFGQNGQVVLNFGASSALANALIVQPDMKILIGGYSGNATTKDFALIRLLPNGTLDGTFATGGGTLTSISPGNDLAYGMALHPDGRIVLCGKTQFALEGDMAVVQYTSSGELDSGFGNNGIVTFNGGSGSDVAWATGVQSDGRVLITGYLSTTSSAQQALLRFNADGGLDPTFGTNGVVINSNPFGSSYAHAMVAHPSGYILTAGGTYNGSNADFMLSKHVNGQGGDPPNAGEDGTLAICSSDPPTSLFAALQGNPDPGGTWSGPSPMDGVYNPATMGPGLYVYTVSGNGVYPDASATVVVTVAVAADAGSNGSFAICSTTAPTNLFPHLGGNPDPGGQWSFNDEPHPGYYVPATDQPGSYTYTVPGAGPCPAATAIVVVAEPQAPDAGTDATLTLCNNAEVQVMTAALGGAPDANGTWSGPSTTNGLFNPASMLAGIYTYLVPGEPPCGYDSATLTITIQQAPNAGTGGPVVLCPASAPVVLFNELGGDPATNGSWTGPQGPTDGTFSPETDLEGSYTYTVPGSGICADNSAVLNVNVMELELATLTGPTMIPAQETLQYTASPLLNDADSILWSLPEGWTWAPEDLDPYDTNAFVTPSAQASTGSVCAQAVGGECNGEPVCVDVDVTVGVSEAPNDGSGVLVYPNPNNGRFTVRSHVTTDQMTFRLLNAIGQEQAEFSTDTGVVSVDMEGLAAGMYTLKWTNRSRSGSRTVILVR